MEKIEIPGGFTLQLTGKPDLTMIQVPLPPRVGVSAGDIPFIRPKLLVREGDRVQTGSPVFTDKRDRSVTYVSPATGQVEKIVFGERRRLMEVVIATDTADDFVSFDPVSPSKLDDMPREELVDRLKQGGLWQGLRQFPARDTADPDALPAMIIVSMNGNDLFSPHPVRVLEENESNFHTGLAILRRFSHRIVVTVRESCLKALQKLDPDVAEQVTHVTDDVYPAWNPGAVLYQIKRNQAENASWCISLDHLVMMGQFLTTGQYPVHKVVTVTQAGDRRPHMKLRQGTPLKKIAGHSPPGSLITTGQFNGRLLTLDSHLGFFENTVNILNDIGEEEMFGFVRPGLDKATVSSSFLSSLFRRPQVMDGTLHGELRACINCSYCERICPVGLMPNFIMKALHAEEVEEALGLGMMDCCQCGLCAYTCPSKIELAKILCDGMESHHKDKA